MIGFYRSSTNRWRTLMGQRPLRSGRGGLSHSCAYLKWTADRWRSRSIATRRAYIHWRSLPPWRNPSHWWFKQAMCIHSHEGAWNDNTGNSYFGGMQFLESTWKRAGGADHPAFHHPGDQAHFPFTVSPREQLHRAYVIWKSGGGSWHEWGTAGACGLR